uniref:Uridylate-specific endoribonuclease n=1 Tax=Sus scrofa TaxID=9823 RepID=A0A8D0VGZ3_PIG
MRACVPLIVAMLCGLAWAGKMESCASRCHEKFDRDASCQCDRRCPRHGDCCEDYEHLCIAEEDPKDPEPFLELEEEAEGAPASNLYSAPDSCHGRCWEAFDKHHPCHCNARCREFGNCCEDFESLCGHEGFSHSSDAITKEELRSISEKIYRADTNKAQKEDIILNSQNRIPPSETRDQVDRCPEPLFTYVNEKLFSKPTYAAFINLLNNYQRATGRGEHFTAQQLAEQDTFLREIMSTAVMKTLYGFLHQQSEWGRSLLPQALRPKLAMLGVGVGAVYLWAGTGKGPERSPEAGTEDSSVCFGSHPHPIFGPHLSHLVYPPLAASVSGFPEGHKSPHSPPGHFSATSVDPRVSTTFSLASAPSSGTKSSKEAGPLHVFAGEAATENQHRFGGGRSTRKGSGWSDSR